MKKSTNVAKLQLKLETVKGLSPDKLTHVVGGATANGCVHPTTTVLPTGRC